MVLRRAPRSILQPFVEYLWAADEPHAVAPRREHVLPTGQMHVVFRLSGEPLRLFADTRDRSGHFVGHAVIGGARDTFYIRHVSEPLCSVGAQLRPGAAEVLFGMPADELCRRHTHLEDIWGRSVAWMRERLAEMPTLEQRIDALESMLLARRPRIRAVHPAVAHALEAFTTTSDVRRVVKASGYSHRTLVSLFHRSVGLTPKRYCRVLRFQRALWKAAGRAAVSWADVAAGAGFSDQAHFTREFRAFVGVTPTEYRRIAPRFSHHLPVDAAPR